MCLRTLGVFGDGDLQDLVLLAFQRYLTVCRALQRTYVLEPAGSHGVWSLDDYHLLPFLFGSAQLLGACRRLGTTAPCPCLSPSPSRHLFSRMFPTCTPPPPPVTPPTPATAAFRPQVHPSQVHSLPRGAGGLQQ